MNNLKTIEEELEKILIKEKRSWVRLFELIREVELDALWKPEHPSFTRWIRHLAYESGLTESLIWKRKKAGEIYSDYQKRARKNGITVPKIEDVDVSPDNFELVEKISQGNREVIGDGKVATVWRNSLYTTVTNKFDFLQEVLIKIL